MKDIVLTSKSLAKVNLFLNVKEIVGNEKYHNLTSLMAFVDLSDKITISNNSCQFKLSISSSKKNRAEQDLFDIDGDKNILFKVVEYFAKEFKINTKISIQLEKNIPIAAGLGGGSGNAATLILMINKIANLKLDKKELKKISFIFGCDVPFFMEEKASLVSSRGEKIIKNINFLPQDILLINPNIPLSTADVFKEFDLHTNSKYCQEKQFIETELMSKYLKNFNITAEKLFLIAKNIGNNLEEPAKQLLPIINNIIADLNIFKPEVAMMSGSGSSCFGIFSNKENLEMAEEYFNKKYPSFFIAKTKILADNPSAKELIN
jgi:4-diphosphocytidyl-2-C-methyl-D-erythritol kinase